MITKIQKILLALLLSVFITTQAFAATTFTSSQAASTVNPRTCENGLCYACGTYEITAALVVSDVVQMVRVPAGAYIQEVTLQTDDLDTAGPAIVFDVGDGSVVDRFIDACLSAQVAANDVTCRINQMDGLNYTYTAEDTIDVIVATAPTTGATSGTILLCVQYGMQGLQS